MKILERSGVEVDPVTYQPIVRITFEMNVTSEMTQDARFGGPTMYQDIAMRLGRQLLEALGVEEPQ